MSETKNSEIVNLPSALQYQTRSVISRVLMKNAGGTITLFAFDQGEGLSEHKTPYDAFVTLIEGEAKIRIGDHEHQLKTGDSIILPANVPHAVDALTQFKMLLTMTKAPK